MAERSYKTDKLREYSTSFCQVAEQIFRLASRQVGTQRTVQHEGSYSITATTTDETVAKILIFEPDRGRRFGNWPLMNPGVYVLIRVNGRAGQTIWSDSIRHEFERFFARMPSNNEDVAVAPNYDERFMFFPVMAGESLDDIAHFMAAVSTV
jgi:hypothetical protein